MAAQSPRTPPRRRRPTISLTLAPETVGLIAARGNPLAPERSIVVDRVIAEHDWLLRSARPNLSREQWLLLLDLLNGSLFTMCQSRMLLYELADAIRLDQDRPEPVRATWAPWTDSWSHKHGTDASALLAQLQSLPPVALAAILDVARRWWAQAGDAIHPVPGEPGYQEAGTPEDVDRILSTMLAL